MKINYKNCNILFINYILHLIYYKKIKNNTRWDNNENS